MTKKVIFGFFSILFLSFQAQSTDELSKKIDFYVQKKISSPNEVIPALNEILTQHPKLDDTLKAKIYFALVPAYGITNQNPLAKKYGDEGLIYFDEKNKLKTTYLTFLGNVYYVAKQYKQAEDFYKKALKQNALVNKSPADDVNIMGKIGTLYINNGKEKEGLSILLKANEVVEKNKNFPLTDKLLLKQRIASTYLITNQVAFAAEEYEQIAPGFEILNKPRFIVTNKGNLADCFIELGKSAKALALLKDIGGQISEKESMNFGLGNWNYLMAKYYFTKGDVKRAKYHINQSRSYWEKEKNLPIFPKDQLRNSILLTRIYIHEKEYAKAEQLIQEMEKKEDYTEAPLWEKNKFIVIKNQVYNALNKDTPSLDKNIKKITDSTKGSTSSLVFNLQQQKYKADVLEKRKIELIKKNREMLQKQNKHLFYFWSSIAILFFIFLVYFVRNKNRKNKQQKVLAEQKQTLIKSKKEEKVLKEMITQLKSNTKNDINKEIGSIKKDKKGFNHFMAKINLIHPEFSTELRNRYPSLTNADLQFCGLIRLELSNKEISSILNIEIESLYRKKYRLQKKMGLQNDLELRQTIFNIG